MNDSPAPEAEKLTLMPLPVTTTNDALPHLRRPFSPSAVKWKVQASGPKGKPAEYAIVVGYIDARLVSARLNKVVGGNWQEKPVRVEGSGNALLCELTLFPNSIDQQQTHTDLGIGQGGDTEMKLKAVHSDSLKRVATRFGVGESLYAMPQIFITVTDDGAETNEGVPTLKRKSDGKPGFLRETHERYLRGQYADWLKAEGEEDFGEVLGHGDAEVGSVGEVEADEPDAETAAAPLEDEKAKELIAEARTLRDAVRAIDPEALAEQSFDNAMAQREHSHERLEDFVGNLRELLANVERFEDLKGQLAEKLDEADLKKAVDKAKRRGSRAERVEVLEAALDEAGKGGSGDGS